MTVEMGVPLEAGMSTSPRRDVVFTFAFETWRDAARRELTMPSDRLAAALLDRPEVGRLVIANPYRSIPIRAARRLSGQDQPPFPAVRPERQVLLSPGRLRRADPDSVPGLERAYRRYSGRLREAAARIGMERPAVLTVNPFVAAFGVLDWAGPVTFYAWDDWAAHPLHRRWWPAYRAASERMRERGTNVCAVSGVLLARLAPTGAGVTVPNGIDPAEWARPASAPAWFEELRRPRILYIGALDSRLDTDAVAEVAGRNPGGTVVLVGPLLQPDALEPLRRQPNLRIEPPVARGVIASLVTSAEVCVMPHRRTALTEAMSPLKIYEYLAGGRPVVATGLPPVRGIDPRVVLVAPGESFADGVATALTRGPATEEERARFVAANCWSRRHDAILEVALR